MLPLAADGERAQTQSRQPSLMTARLDARTGGATVASQRPAGDRAPRTHLTASLSRTHARQGVGHACAAAGAPLRLARAALEGLAARGGTHAGGAVWAGVATEGLGDQGFLVHPAVADAAIHAGAVLRRRADAGFMVTVALGCYAVPHMLRGGSLPRHLRALDCTLQRLLRACLSGLRHAPLVVICTESEQRRVDATEHSKDDPPCHL